MLLLARWQNTQDCFFTCDMILSCVSCIFLFVNPPVDACTLDIRPLLCLLWRRWVRLLISHLPERGGVVLPPSDLEEPQQPSHTTCRAGKASQETGEGQKNTNTKKKTKQKSYCRQDTLYMLEMVSYCV